MSEVLTGKITDKVEQTALIEVIALHEEDAYEKSEIEGLRFFIKEGKAPNKLFESEESDQCDKFLLCGFTYKIIQLL